MIMLQTYKKIHYAIITTLCMLAYSCAEEIEIQTPKELPAQFNVILDDYGMSRSTEQWPDRACVMIYDSSSNSVSGYLTYSAFNNKWAVNISDDVNMSRGTDTPCDLFYVKGFSMRDYSDYPVSYVRASAAQPVYSGKGLYNYTVSSFSISGNLQPRTARVRLRGDLSSVESYSSRWVYHNPNSGYTGYNYNYVNWDMSRTEEGYSPYLYVDYIPKFRKGDILYKYKGNRLLQAGNSYVIEAPSGTESNNTWEVDRILFNEPYKRVRVNPEQPYTVVKNSFESSSGFIILFFMQFMPYDGSNTLSYTSEKTDAFRMILKRADGTLLTYDFKGSTYTPSKTGGYYIDEFFNMKDVDIAEIYFESDFDIELTISDFTLERQ